MKRHDLRRSAGALLMTAAILLAAAAAAAPTWNGTITEEEGWPVVNNPDKPLKGDRVIEPEQMWRIGGDEEDILFGLIEDAVVDEEGYTYLLDTVLSSVLVVDDEGEVVRQVSGEGDGPGEFRFARELVFLPDGALGIMEMMPGKIVSVTRDGTPRPSFALEDTDGGGMMNHLQHIAAHGDAVLIGRVSTTFGEGTATVHRLLSLHGADGVQKAVIREDKDEQNSSNIQIGGDDGDEFTQNFTLGTDGSIVIYPDSRKYELQVYTFGGEKKRIIRRAYESVRRPEKELEAARKQAEEMSAQFGGAVEIEVPEMADDIGRVIARPDGALWVSNSRGSRESGANEIGWFDAYDSDGKYVQRVLLKADYDAERDNYTLFGDRLFVFKEAQLAPPRQSTIGGAGGGATMIMMVGGGGGAEEEDEDEEALPYEVICYRLPR